jgi:hypothetical protein
MGRQLTEKDRDLVIKEARQAVLHDVRHALARLQDELGQQEPDVARAAKFIAHYLGLKLSDVAQGTEGSGYPRVGHDVWGGGE